MSQISITVPRDDETALIAAGTFFLTLAGKVPALELDNADPVEKFEAAETNDVADKFMKLDESGSWVDPATTTEQPAPPPPPPPVTEAPPVGKPAIAVPELAKDSTGALIPHDTRIHAGSAAVLKDGTWRLKRGVDAELVKAVEDELKALVANGPVETLSAAPPPPPPEQQTTSAPEGGQQPAPPPPPPPEQQTQPAPPPPPAGVPTTFPEFLQAVTPMMSSGAIKKEDIDQAVANQGKPGVDKTPHLMANLDLIPGVWAELTA